MEDLILIANGIYDQNEGSEEILRALRDGKHSKQTLRNLLFAYRPNLSNQETEKLLSLVFALYVFELADTAGTSPIKSSMALDAYFLVSAIRKKDRGNKALVRNSLRFLSFYYWIDFTLDDASSLVQNLKKILNN